jgi:hypothetical protein
MNHGRFVTLHIRAEKDRGAKYTLEGRNQPTILRSALLHSERV